MKNYNTLNDYLKEDIANFVKNITSGLGKVDTHFMCDMFTGILSHNSINLSDVVRSTGNTNIKKGVERLERHLDSFGEIESIIEANYTKMIKPYINNRKLYFVDRSDIVKDEKTNFENLGFVLDGSDSHKIKHGYQINEITTIDNCNQPISLVSELRSSKDEDYLSDNELWMKHISNVFTTYGNGTFIFDRGYDGALLMEKMAKLGCDFIIRAKHLERYVYVNDKKTTISDLAKKHKGFYNFNTTIHGKKNNLKVSVFNIRIKSNDAKELSDVPLSLVIVKGYALDEKTLNEAYMALITSRIVVGKNSVLQVVRDYMLRWKIEENFKYKKQQFKLEKVMVRRYKRIQVLNKILTITMFFSNIVNMKAYGKTIRKIKLHLKKEVKFWLYRISDGIKKVISFFSDAIMKILYPKPQKRRRDLWTVMGVRYSGV